jgi:hypothetical protein
VGQCRFAALSGRTAQPVQQGLALDCLYCCVLQAHRAQGNEALHQMQTPSSADLTAALDVLEHLLKTQ